MTDTQGNEYCIKHDITHGAWCIFIKSDGGSKLSFVSRFGEESDAKTEVERLTRDGHEGFNIP